METKAVELFKNELRTGTFIISQGFKRDHHRILELIKKYESDFLDLETKNKGVLNKLSKRRIPVKNAGRPIDEILLNNKQVLFLISLLRGTKNIILIKKQAIQAGTLTAILEAIDNFDFGETDIRYVYAAMDSQKRIKIGISNNPEKRIKNLNIGNADELKLVMVKKAEKPKYQSETELHKNFKAYKIRSEWFSSNILDLLDVERPCTAERDGEDCQCKACREYSDISDCVLFSKIEDPEHHQKEIKEYIINKGFSEKQAQDFVDTSNDIGWFM